ncbi:uncharacterized protein KY384_008492 [Bacidia gigantensis]|uniref:uncharacterized protein n=1 Tax=Bacidia gigantensis TaxID=2732470 RepID=UPI001D03876C|nr:uncharacterized protein KY384_008492 [Bacidia gigantensis]KAG8527063.1 hypothetical protein KY384_008492 [Bacidia gigantensis]
MEFREVQEKSKDLQKATAANANSDHIIKILNDLRTGVKPNEDLLRQTKIGVIVNRSKAHKDPKISRLASEIVKKWRDDIDKQKSGRSSPASDKKGITSGTASPLPTNGTKLKPGVPLDQRDFKKDKINTAKTNQATRDNCIGLLYNGLCFMSPDPASEVLNVAVAVEAAGYAHVGPESNAGYTTKMRSLYMNLKNKSNSKLRRQVLDGEIKPDQLVKMSSEELKSEERRLADNALIKENMKEAQMPQAEKSISTAIQCKNPKCGKNTVAYTQAQTRSADEPMTTFCECQSCGRRWKINLHALARTASKPSRPAPSSRGPRNRGDRSSNRSKSAPRQQRGEIDNDEQESEVESLTPEQEAEAEAQKKAEADYMDSLIFSAIENPESVPPTFRESEEGTEFLSHIHVNKVEPREFEVKDLLGHQLGGKGRLAGLWEMARRVALKEQVQFESQEEREDVMMLVEKIRNDNLDKDMKEKMGRPSVGKEEAEEGARNVLEKWVRGRYEQTGGAEGVLGEVGRAYMTEDAKSVLRHVKKLLSQGRVRPQGKVAEAVGAGAP